ncbi:hypothetical protein LIER_09079 [Lithospermum erythrorhizon]|uniref:Uncharacterized protein n=1 Tax=Lithospermum erythrorhizon TaxID=34254 RepID=A0AAV3PEH4_LITER
MAIARKTNDHASNNPQVIDGLNPGDLHNQAVERSPKRCPKTSQPGNWCNREASGADPTMEEGKSHGTMSRPQVAKTIMRQRHDVQRPRLPNKMLWQHYGGRWMPSLQKLLDRPNEGQTPNWQS